MYQNVLLFWRMLAAPYVPMAGYRGRSKVDTAEDHLEAEPKSANSSALSIATTS